MRHFGREAEIQRPWKALLFGESLPCDWIPASLLERRVFVVLGLL